MQTESSKFEVQQEEGVWKAESMILGKKNLSFVLRPRQSIPFEEFRFWDTADSDELYKKYHRRGVYSIKLKHKLNDVYSFLSLDTGDSEKNLLWKPLVGNEPAQNQYFDIFFLPSDDTIYASEPESANEAFVPGSWGLSVPAARLAIRAHGEALVNAVSSSADELSENWLHLKPSTREFSVTADFGPNEVGAGDFSPVTRGVLKQCFKFDADKSKGTDEEFLKGDVIIKINGEDIGAVDADTLATKVNTLKNEDHVVVQNCESDDEYVVTWESGQKRFSWLMIPSNLVTD